MLSSQRHNDFKVHIGLWICFFNFSKPEKYSLLNDRILTYYYLLVLWIFCLSFASAWGNWTATFESSWGQNCNLLHKNTYNNWKIVSWKHKCIICILIRIHIQKLCHPIVVSKDIMLGKCAWQKVKYDCHAWKATILLHKKWSIIFRFIEI